MRNSQHSLSSNGSEQLELLAEEEELIDRPKNLQTKQSFNRLYWSGVVSLQLPSFNGFERRSIGPDVKQEKELYEDLELDDEDSWQFLYDPHKFNEENKPLMLDKYKLTQEQLFGFAKDLTKLRQAIDAKAMDVNTSQKT